MIRSFAVVKLLYYIERYHEDINIRLSSLQSIRAKSKRTLDSRAAEIQ